MLQSKQCRNCHSLGGSGGLRGPALDGVATRLTGDQLVRQVIQGGGNMPAYGKNLSPAEVTALVAFMQTLHGPNDSPARDMTAPESRARRRKRPPVLGVNSITLRRICGSQRGSLEGKYESEQRGY